MTRLCKYSCKFSQPATLRLLSSEPVAFRLLARAHTRPRRSAMPRPPRLSSRPASTYRVAIVLASALLCALPSGARASWAYQPRTRSARGRLRGRGTVARGVAARRARAAGAGATAAPPSRSTCSEAWIRYGRTCSPSTAAWTRGSRFAPRRRRARRSGAWTAGSGISRPPPRTSRSRAGTIATSPRSSRISPRSPRSTCPASLHSQTWTSTSSPSTCSSSRTSAISTSPETGSRASFNAAVTASARIPAHPGPACERCAWTTTTSPAWISAGGVRRPGGAPPGQ